MVSLLVKRTRRKDTGGKLLPHVNPFWCSRVIYYERA